MKTDFYHKTDKKILSDAIYEDLIAAKLPCARYQDDDGSWVIVSVMNVKELSEKSEVLDDYLNWRKYPDQ